jgi:hypothetical protein
MGKLDELTPEFYLKYKKAEMTDTEIGRIFDCSLESVVHWKRRKGLTGVNIRNWETWDKYFPEDVARLKRSFLRYYNWNWTHQAIADEMGLGRNQLTVFKDRYFPDLMRRKRIAWTAEQKAIATANGINLNTAEKRVQSGMDPDMAVRIKPQQIKKNHVKTHIYDYFTKEEVEKAKAKGISRHTLRGRIGLGWDKWDCLNIPCGTQGRRENDENK